MRWILILLVVPSVLACVVPQEGMVVTSSVQFCSDVHFFDRGIRVTGRDIAVSCDGTVFKSWSGGKGISIEHAENVSVSGCRIVNYDIGLYVRNSSEVFLEDNHLVKNQVGTRLVVVRDSATFNHDVSLQVPFEVFESEHNALSLTNKPVEGLFCGENLCNERRNALEAFMKPQTPQPEMQSWLVVQLREKSRQTLLGWLLSGLTAG